MLCRRGTVRRSLRFLPRRVIAKDTKRGLVSRMVAARRRQARTIGFTVFILRSTCQIFPVRLRASPWIALPSRGQLPQRTYGGNLETPVGGSLRVSLDHVADVLGCAGTDTDPVECGHIKTGRRIGKRWDLRSNRGSSSTGNAERPHVALACLAHDWADGIEHEVDVWRRCPPEQYQR